MKENSKSFTAAKGNWINYKSKMNSLLRQMMKKKRLKQKII